MKEKKLDTVDGKQFLTVEEAGQRLGVASNAIRNYLYLGRLSTYKFKTLTLLDAREVEGWKKRQK